MRLFIALSLLLLPSMAAGALRYLPADDDRPLIRRHLLPLDIDSIAALAGHLAVLADGPFPESAALVQHRVKVLTLSQRLDPPQKRARAIEEAFLEGKDRPRPDEKERKFALARVLDHTAWLTDLPDDSEGRLLGWLLLDIVPPFAPDHPLLKNRRDSGSIEPWKGVVANLADFGSHETPDRPAPPPPAAGDSKRKEYAETALLTEVPMIFSKTSGEETSFSSGLVRTSLVITRAPMLESEEGKPAKPSPGKLVFKPEPETNTDALHELLRDFFKSRLESLPTGYNLNINTNRKHYLAANRDNITAPIAMMLDSAATGRPLRRDTILLARLRPDGSLEKPARAWQLLFALADLHLADKARLIVGPGMLEELTGLLVLEKASFFNNFEVLEASTFEEARALFFEDGQMPEALQLARDGYLEVRQKADQANNLGNFLSLASVESRLARASRLSPRHLSAKLWAIQADRRPAYFTPYMTARDLHRRLEPLSQFRFVIDKTTERDVKDAYKASRDLLAPLERLLRLSEKELFEEASSLIKKINSAVRDASSDPLSPQEAMERNIEEFQEELKQFRKKLLEIPAEDPPKKNQ